MAGPIGKDIVLVGTATNNTTSDLFVGLTANNTILTVGGNETISGGAISLFGFDNATFVNLGTTFGASPPSNTDVTDTIVLDGSNNTITGPGAGQDTLLGGAFSEAILASSTVSVTVTGLGNAVGGNYVGLDNVGGINTVSLVGTSNIVHLNADAADAVNAGSGFDLVEINTPNDRIGAGFISTVALSGNGNIVIASDQNLSVGGGVNSNQIEAGNGNDSVALGGSGNLVELGNGSDSVSIGGSNNNVFLEFFGPSAAPNSDFVSIGGDFNQVRESSASDRNNVVVNIAGAIGFNQVVLGDGNDNASAGGQNNLVQLGNGNDIVSLLGTAGFDNVQVGSGLDTVTVNGNGNVINVDPGNLVTTDTVTATGNSNRINMGSSGTATPSTLNLGGGSGDSVSLGTGSFNVNGSGSNNVINAADAAGSSSTIDLGSAAFNSISLGNGADTVTDNGSTVVISAGNGNDSVAANGNQVQITLGNGNDHVAAQGSTVAINLGSGSDTVSGGGNDVTVTAGDNAGAVDSVSLGNGSGNAISLGNGNDLVIDVGNNVTIGAGNGNDVVIASGNTVSITLGSGNDRVSAAGSNDAITVNGTITSHDSLDLGSSSAGSITSGVDSLALVTNDTFDLIGLQAGSALNLLGTNDLAFLTNNSSADITFGSNAMHDTLAVFGSGGTYNGVLTLHGFGVGVGVLDLQGLVGGVDGRAIDSFAELGANLQTVGGTLELALANHGSIIFAGGVAGSLTPADVAFS